MYEAGARNIFEIKRTIMVNCFSRILTENLLQIMGSNYFWVIVVDWVIV